MQDQGIQRKAVVCDESGDDTVSGLGGRREINHSRLPSFDSCGI